MISSQFIYIVTTCLIFLPVLFFYFYNKKYRKDILFAGLILGISSVLTAYFFWTKDWWSPETVLGTRVGVEDFILGFNTGALAVIINSIISPIKKNSNKRNWNIIFSTVFVFGICMLLGFYLLDITSFISYMFSMLICMFWIYINTRISPIKSLIFSVAYSVLSIPIYFVILFLSKDWVTSTWNSEFLSDIFLFGFIPIEEFIFWLLFGLLFRQIYVAWLK